MPSEYIEHLGDKRWRVSWDVGSSRQTRVVIGTLRDAKNALSELPAKDARERLKGYEADLRNHKFAKK